MAQHQTTIQATYQSIYNIRSFESILLTVTLSINTFSLPCFITLILWISELVIFQNFSNVQTHTQHTPSQAKTIPNSHRYSKTHACTTTFTAKSVSKTFPRKAQKLISTRHKQPQQATTCAFVSLFSRHSSSHLLRLRSDLSLVISVELSSVPVCLLSSWRLLEIWEPSEIWETVGPDSLGCGRKTFEEFYA